jgi:hypothetical protein
MRDLNTIRADVRQTFVAIAANYRGKAQQLQRAL